MSDNTSTTPVAATKSYEINAEYKKENSTYVTYLIMDFPSEQAAGICFTQATSTIKEQKGAESVKITKMSAFV